MGHPISKNRHSFPALSAVKNFMLKELEKHIWLNIIERDRKEEKKLIKSLKEKNFRKFDKLSEKSFKELREKI